MKQPKLSTPAALIKPHLPNGPLRGHACWDCPLACSIGSPNNSGGQVSLLKERACRALFVRLVLLLCETGAGRRSKEWSRFSRLKPTDTMWISVGSSAVSLPYALVRSAQVKGSCAWTSLPANVLSGGPQRPQENSRVSRRLRDEGASLQAELSQIRLPWMV